MKITKVETHLVKPRWLFLELDRNALADKIDHDWQNPQTYHPDDGSVVDR